ncbi:retrovirus-related Pol polyprotein from transposon TNT 1-94 [Trichonephila clavipes]|nr:retrovirus-related Pol polyprotein from transposon TNT 1-94 [Trichonephila clavipes]
MDKITIPDLNGTNYFIWELKMKAALSLKRLVPLILEEKPEDLTRKDEMDWITKNSDAIAYIKLSLADEQALQFAAEDNAKVLWDKIRAIYMGEGEDRKIDAGNELKNIRMKNGKTVADYIARARGISTKCHSLRLDVSPRELVYHTVRGLNGKFSKVRDILKTQRGKSMDEILQILREEEATLNLPIKTRMDGINEAFYYTYLANSGIFHEKTIPYNSESNGKAERANRVLLERARSLLYESKLPLKFWAEAINCSTQVSNVTPRKGKEKNPIRNLDSLSERNEINQNTENGVLYNFDINNGPGAIENDNSIPFQTTSSPRTGRIQIPVLELNDVQNQIPVRRSERLKSKLMSVHLVNNVPNSYFEAENSANWKNWKLAMENELDSLDKHKVWEIVQKRAKSKLIKTKWVYSLKQDDAGKNIKYKARLVAAGFNQIKNIDYSESYSPVVNIESFRLLIALAAKLKLNVNFFDVKTAYLYGDLEETVYVLPPPGYEKLIGDDKVCKLKKSIYGLPQSGRNWYMKIKGELENFGLKQLASDNCVFIKSVNQSVLILCMYVDDLAIFCNNDKMYEDIVSKIKNVFEVVENKTNKFLGMEIEKCENGIYLSQCDYINSLLVKHNLENCKSVKTPIVKGEDKIFPSTNEFIDITMYQELIGELLYLANRTRPDISFVMSYLSQFNHNPDKRHYNLAKRVLRYLMGSKDKKLFYENEFGILNASSDASWGNAENGKSFFGGVVLLGNSLILWKCRKQKSVSFSTCEAELLSISEICKDIIWIVNLLIELKCEQFINNAVTLNSDIQAAIQWIKGTRSSNKSRHMNLHFHFIKDLIEDTVIKLEYVQTEFLIADFLTKAMNVEKLEYSMQKIALLS